MTKYLVTFSRDWADEFQAEGFAILNQEEWNKLQVWAKSGRSFFFGTNEGWEDGEDLSEDFTSVEITAEEEATLKKLFPDLAKSYNPNFGQFPHVDFLEEDEEFDEQD